MPELRTYKRGKTEIVVNGSRQEILKNRIFSEIKKNNFVRLPNSQGAFSILPEKGIFIKRALIPETDLAQMKDYLDQSKFVDNIPEIYGYIQKNRQLYIIQKLIKESVPLSEHLSSLDRKGILKVKEEIKITGERLLEKGLLPWDYTIRNLIFSKKENKLYVCDNMISPSNPKRLHSLIVKSGLKPSKKLILLKRLSQLDLTAGLANGIRAITKKDSLVGNSKILAKTKEQLMYLKRKLFFETKKVYSSLTLEEQKKMQEIILDKCLAEFDAYLK